MTTLLAVPEVAVPELPDGDELRLFDGESTLEERIAGAWEQLAAGQTAECPVCGGPLRPRWSAGAGVVGGRCDSCGTELG
jgi:tRNA(Ile2) C34 agmatinyltransferase TiaS